MRRREAVEHIEKQFLISERRACVIIGQSRSTQRIKYHENTGEIRLLKRIDELVKENPRSGYRNISGMLRLEGWSVNNKRVYRLWRREGYRVPKAKKKNILGGSAKNACNKKIALFPNDIWTYDFIFDRLSDGRALKILVITDEYTREVLLLEVGISVNGTSVVNALNKLTKIRGLPCHVRSDNGSEFISKAVKQWFLSTGSSSLYIEKGSPWQNGYAESLNSRFRDECLNMNMFYTMKEAREIIGNWQITYNERRPHSALGGLPPSVFARKVHEQRSGCHFS